MKSQLGLFVIALNLLLGSRAWAGTEIRNGGDVFEIGGATKVFDEIEFSKPFFPEDQGEAWNLLSAQLSKFEAKLPLSGAYLRSMFLRGRITWTFVEADLRDVQDEGKSNLFLSYKGEQAAINQDNIVQVSDPVWKKLLDPSRAYLMLHEATWVANGRKALQDGATVRRLVGVLSDPKLDSYLTENLAKTLLSIFPDDKSASSSHFVRLVRFELKNLSVISNFTVSERYNRDTSDIIIQQRADGILKDAEMTRLNPNRGIDRLKFVNGQMKANYLGQEFPIDMDQLCSIPFGNQNGWRLPTLKEIYELHRQQFQRVRYVLPSEYPVAWGQDMTEAFIYPQSHGKGSYLLLTEEGFVLDAVNAMQRVDAAKSLDGPVEFFCIRGTAQANADKAKPTLAPSASAPKKDKQQPFKNSILLHARDRRLHALYSDDHLVWLKRCSDALEKDPACQRHGQIQAIPHYEFQRLFQAAMGPELTLYAGPSALTQARADQTRLQSDLSNPNLSPAELQTIQQRLRKLSQIIWKLERAESLFQLLVQNKFAEYTEGLHDLYDYLMLPFANKRSAWTDAQNKISWFRSYDKPVSWFDAQGLADTSISSSIDRDDATLLDCAKLLGDGWRLPTVAEAIASHQQGLRSSHAGNGAASFWTSDQEAETKSEYPLAFVFSIGKSAPRAPWDKDNMLCVHAALE